MTLHDVSVQNKRTNPFKLTAATVKLGHCHFGRNIHKLTQKIEKKERKKKKDTVASTQESTGSRNTAHGATPGGEAGEAGGGGGDLPTRLSRLVSSDQA